MNRFQYVLFYTLCRLLDLHMRTLLCPMVFLLAIGCGSNENPTVTQSTIVDGDPSKLFYSLTPPVSSGDHYLKISGNASDYVWLFGAYNNGRREENVLIEKTPEAIRLRAWWYTSSDKMWCLESELSDREFHELLQGLKSNNAFDLPNLMPDVSHAMTYWVKIKNNSDKHEACAYYIDQAPETTIFGRDKEFALNWSNVVSTILGMRTRESMQIRPAKFDKNGNVYWNLPVPDGLDTSDAFDW